MTIRFSTSTNCDSSVNYNQGCGASFAKPASYGNPFNAQGGGWFVMARTPEDGIRIWFWSRNDPNVPPEICDSDSQDGPSDLTPSPSWGRPEASFPLGDNCDYDSHFDAHSMVFDLTFCVSHRVVRNDTDAKFCCILGRLGWFCLS